MFKVLINNYSQSFAERTAISFVVSSFMEMFHSCYFQVLKIRDIFMPKLSILAKKPNKMGGKPLSQDASQLENIQNVIDFIKEGVILLDDNGTILSVNCFIEKLWGFKKEQLLGNSITTLIGSCGISQFWESWAKRDCPPQVFRIKGKKENESFFHTEIVLQKPKIGNFHYYMLNIHDISSQVEAEKALNEKKMELDMLIYKISHDLRGPLTSIFGLVNLASMQDISLREITKYVSLIDRSACKLDSTIKELIFFNEISSRPVLYSNFLVSDIIQQSIQEVVETEECEEVSFNFLLEEEIELRSDITLIRNVLTNLLTNSAKYKKENQATFVDIRFKKTSTNLEIEVEDNGQGIAENVQDKVFNMFYRGNSKSQGSGLGLFLVKQSVEKLKGEIKLESSLHKGSRFTVILPLINT